MNVCRACASPSPNGDTVSIFSSIDGDISWAKVLIDCTRVQILESEAPLPSILCGGCAETVEGMYQFIKKVQLSDRKLRKELVVKANQQLELDGESHIVYKYRVADETVDYNPHTEEHSDDETVPDEPEYTQPKEASRSTDSSSRTSLNDRPTTAMHLGDAAPNQKNGDAEEGEHTLQEIEIDGKFVCCGCLKVFDTISEQRAHSMKAHSKKRSTNNAKTNVCEVCNRRYYTARALQLHLRKTTEVKHIYECAQCHKRYTEPGKARQHALERIHLKGKGSLKHETESNGGPKICCAQACGISFETEQLLLHHAHNAHRINKIESSLVGNRQKPIECYVCFKRFETELSLERHQKRNYKPLSYQCAACGLKFRGGEALATHERSHRNEKPFSCDTCRRSFASKTVLKAHLLTHSEERPFVCETCGRGFRRKRNLQVHALSHTADQPFRCDQCPARFKAKAHLNYHTRTHTGVKPYQCRYCEKTFADHTNRARHEISHTGIKPYECSHCNKTFIRKRLLVDHERTHTEFKPYDHGDLVLDPSIRKKL